MVFKIRSKSRMNHKTEKETAKVKKHRLRNISLILAAAVVLLAGAFLFYTGNYYHAQPETLSVLTDGQSVKVTDTEAGFVFLPEEKKTDTAFIFYPGAKVETSAYSSLMQKIAENGYLCILAKMPFNLAVFNAGAAADIMDTYKEIKHWYIGGHSLGGAMAADFASKNDESLDGLILLGAYPAADLTNSDFKVLSIFGSQDQIMNREKYSEGLKKMPVSHEELEIEGGNHAQFGNYGNQSGDGEATISVEEQQKQTAKEIIHFLKS